MNDHEAQRIAAAMHAARPDWPASSLLTLIRKKLMDRPRRDVFVALAWVASEPNSATPARVLESGPWWKAAAVEGGSTRQPYDPRATCSTCSKSQEKCEATRPSDHTFVSIAAYRAELNPDAWMDRRLPRHPTPETPTNQAPSAHEEASHG